MQRITHVVLIAVLIPALAGATALFSLIDQVILVSPGFPDPDRIVHLSAPFALLRSAPARAREIQERERRTALIAQRAIAHRATLFQLESEAIVDWGIQAAVVSPEFFDLFGILPQQGRTLQARDAGASPRPVIISDALWTTRFSNKLDIINAVVDVPGTLRNQPWQIVGVMPRSFDFPKGTNFWTAHDASSSPPALTPDFVRLASGVSVSMLGRELPGVRITPLADYMRPTGARLFGFLLASFTLFLLVAWVQVGARLATQTIDEIPEVAARIAVGARSTDLLNDFARQAVFLVLVITPAVWFLTPTFIAALLAASPLEFQHRAIGADYRAAAFLAGLTGVGVGLWAVCKVKLSNAVDPAALLRGHLGGRIQHRSSTLRRRIFIANIALLTAFTYLAGLSYRSYERLNRIDMGFVAEQLYAVPVPVPAPPRGASGTELRELEARHRQLARETYDRLQSLGQVTAVSVSETVPLAEQGVPTTMLVDGDQSRAIAVVRESIGRGWVTVIGGELRDGREPGFDETATFGLPGVIERAALINERLAASLGAHWADIRLWSSSLLRYRIVGVIKDIPTGRLDGAVEPALYPFLPSRAWGPFLLVRGSTSEVGQAIQDVLQSVWGPLAPRRIIDVSALADNQLRQYRASLFVMLTLLAFTAPLAGLGMVGSLWNFVEWRRPRTAIEIALGASPAAVMRSLIATVLNQTFSGVVLGGLVGFWTGMLYRRSVFGVDPVDGALFAGAFLVPLGVTAAITVPLAKRAYQINLPATLTRMF